MSEDAKKLSLDEESESKTLEAVSETTELGESENGLSDSQGRNLDLILDIPLKLSLIHI